MADPINVSEIDPSETAAGRGREEHPSLTEAGVRVIIMLSAVLYFSSGCLIVLCPGGEVMGEACC